MAQAWLGWVGPDLDGLGVGCGLSQAGGTWSRKAPTLRRAWDLLYPLTEKTQQESAPAKARGQCGVQNSGSGARHNFFSFLVLSWVWQAVLLCRRWGREEGDRLVTLKITPVISGARPEARLSTHHSPQTAWRMSLKCPRCATGLRVWSSSRNKPSSHAKNCRSCTEALRT